MKHSTRTAVLLLLLACGESFSQQTEPAEPETGPAASSARPTFLVVPHNHWEGAVFKTREEYLEMGLPHILEALNLLARYPEYRFVLDQVAYVKPFLERYPEQAATFRRFVEEGRLELAGANITMPDVNMPSGESWVRHVLYGKRYYREALGVDVKVGWSLDSFGHHAQMPQLLRAAGFDSYWFQRGPSNDMPSNFLWEGIDGTRIPAFWLAQTYVAMGYVPTNPVEFDRHVRSRYRDLDPYTDWPVRVALAGWDVTPPERHLPDMIRQFNQNPNRSLDLKFAVPSDFEKAAEEQGGRDVYKRELNPVFQGIYSSRIEVKQWMRDLERLLTNVEKLGALAKLLGATTDEEALASAWDPVLFNQAHDLASGVMVDKVFDDTMRGYRYAKHVGGELLEAYLDEVSSHIDTRGDGVPLAVFNTLGWTRNDFVEIRGNCSATPTRTQVMRTA